MLSKLLVSLFFVLLLCKPCNAKFPAFAIKQNNPNIVGNSAFIDTDLTLFTMGDFKGSKAETGGFGFSAKLGYISESKYYYALRLSVMPEFTFMSQDRPKRNIFDVSYMTGLLLANNYSRLELNFGISAVTGTKWGKLIDKKNYGSFFGPSYVYEKDKFLTVGFPFDVRLYFTGIAGAGLTAHGNLNPEYSYYSIGVSFTVGNIIR